MTPAEMTITECGELLQYVKGGQWSGTARNMLGQFMHDRGWNSQKEWDEAIRVATERWDSRSKNAKMGSTAYCTVCGKRGAGVRPSGGVSCREHWDTDIEPKFDAATGFALTDESPSPHDAVDARVT
jgi:hypothetical protein